MKNFVKKLYFKSILYSVVFATMVTVFAGDTTGIIHPW